LRGRRGALVDIDRHPEDPILKKINPTIEKIIFNNIESGPCCSLKNQNHYQYYIDHDIDRN